MLVKYGLPVLAVAALGFATMSVVRMTPAQAKVNPVMAPPESVYSAGQIGAVGIVEARHENVAVSLPVSGLVTAVHVSAGDHVTKGQKLFTLDDRDLRAELALRQSNLELSRAKLTKLSMSPRPEEIPEAEAKVREAEALLGDAQVQWNLIESVRDKRAIREEDRLRRQRALAAAQARMEQSKAALALLKAGTWAPDLDVARAEVTQAERQVERVKADLERLVVTSPLTGQVLQCKVRVGEYAQAGPLAQPLMLLGDVSALNVRADIDEKDAWRLKPGAAATASVRGHAEQKLPLTFVRLEPYVVPKKNLTGDATERVDTRVLQAIYQLPAAAPVYTGQQMDVFIAAKDGGRP